MKTIKIRFIYYPTKEYYTIQRRTIFGWRDISYTIDTGYGSVCYCYTDKTDSGLLLLVLAKYYHTTKDFVNVVEYPTILKY